MSAIEQEPQQFTGLAIAAAETLAANLPVPGSGLDTPLSAITQKACPFKVVRIRGIIVITATVAYFTGVKLRQGANNTTTNQVGPTIVPPVPTAGIVGMAQPFEFLDTAPIGLTYSLTALVNTPATCLLIASVTGFYG